MRASETGRDECLTCVRGLRTGQDHPGGDQPIRARCPSRSQTTFMSKMSESQSQNAWSEELEDKLVTLWQEKPCLFNCTIREYSNKIVKSRAVQEISDIHTYIHTHTHILTYVHTYTLYIHIHIYIHTYTGVKTEMGQYWFLRTSAPWEVLVRNQSALVRIFTIP